MLTSSGDIRNFQSFFINVLVVLQHFNNVNFNISLINDLEYLYKKNPFHSTS